MYQYLLSVIKYALANLSRLVISICDYKNEPYYSRKM